MINFGQDGDGVYRGEEYRKVQTEDEAVALMGSIISIGGTSGVVTGRNVNNEEIEEILWIN
jgi:hypothetical protein